ncbi:hypothetical protein EC991_010205 [Linnemannia zychae]|nr:hypothetical protein EC991_010205 [Linnemannia zychae]
MGNMDLRHMRRWMVVLNTFNLLVMTGYYGYRTYEHRGDPEYKWMRVTDWTLIIFASIFFVAYVYALRGQRVLEKHLRVFWMLIPCLTLLGITLNAINFEIKIHSQDVDSSSSSSSDNGAFKCQRDIECTLHWSFAFLTAITGLFALVEIGMAFVWGPLVPRTNLYGQQGYNPGAQVTIVAPYQQLQPQMQQMVYPLQQQPGFVQPQQNFYYQQPLQQQPSFAPIDANTPAGGPLAQPYQFAGQQQQYQSFAQPAPLQQQFQPSPSLQPSPGATASSPYTQQHSPLGTVAST